MGRPSGGAGAFTEAVSHYQRGALQQSEAACRKILKAHPKHPEAIHLLGVIRSQSGDQQTAGRLISKAIQLSPHNPAFLHSRGKVYSTTGNLEEAIRFFRRALEVAPGFALAANELGIVLQRQGHLDEAIESYKRALTIDPKSAEAHTNLGVALQETGHLDGAEASHRTALAIRPRYVDAQVNLGAVLEKQGRHQDAENAYMTALEWDPGRADAAFNFGNVLASQGSTAAAIDAYQKALAIDPAYTDALNNLGTALKDMGRPEQALSAYQRVFAIDPVNPKAHWNNSLALLLLGNFQRGWEGYEWRWKTEDFSTSLREFRKPQWKGESLEGKAILLHAEQGLGDTIQFIRYAPLVKRRGGKVIVECQAPLQRLLSSIPEIDHLIVRGEAWPEFDFQLPLMSLPRVFETDLQSIPNEVPYLGAPEISAPELGPGNGLRVGLVWSGSRQHKNDRNRSIPLGMFERLMSLEGVRFFSIQVDLRAEDAPTLSRFDRIVDLRECLTDFSITAAVIKKLDLVISVDTAVVHLAGALSRPVWTLLPFAPDWRWLLGRSDSPWYPTMRLFRQPSPGDWASVFAEVQAALQGELLRANISRASVD